MKYSIYRMSQEKKISFVTGCIPGSQNRLSEKQIFIKNVEENNGKVGILTVDSDEKGAFYYFIDSNDENLINNGTIQSFLEKNINKIVYDVFNEEYFNIN